MKIDRLFAAFSISARGLAAQRKKLNAVSNNIANVETTRTEQGGPYRRKVVVMTEISSSTFASSLSSAQTGLVSTHPGHLRAVQQGLPRQEAAGGGVEAVELEAEDSYKLVHNPSHPDADENGYVKLPDVNVVSEMVDMIAASRAYEANVAVVNAAKGMAKDALEI